MVITANPPKFDKRQPSRGDYDAIVYIDGSQVIAEDSNGRKIALDKDFQALVDLVESEKKKKEKAAPAKSKKTTKKSK